MQESSEIKLMLRELFASQRLSVLATHHNEQPYTTLVAFVATDDLKQILFATKRDTRKYTNIAENPRVAMFVDNTLNQISDFSDAVAVTATGKAEETKTDERNLFEELYLAKHPYLEEFLMSSNCALLKVNVERYYVVSKFQNVMELHIKNG